MEVVEKREEVCSIASKIVSVKIYRKTPEASNGDGEIVGFDCNSSSAMCEKKCTYRLLLEDF